MRKHLILKNIAIVLLAFASFAFLFLGLSGIFHKTEKSFALDSTLKAHYEFKNASSLTKDSTGQYNLTNSGATYDATNDGVTFGTTGFMYDANDFSNSMSGSYSVAIRVKMNYSQGGSHFLVATGCWGNAFYVQGTWGDLRFSNGKATIQGKISQTSNVEWWRFFYIYNQSSKTMRIIALKEADPTYSVDYSMSATTNANFGDGGDYTLCIGGQCTKTGSSFDCHITNNSGSTVTLSNLLIYSSAISDSEIANIKAVFDARKESKDPEPQDYIYQTLPYASYQFTTAGVPGQDSAYNFNLNPSSSDYSLSNGVLTLNNGCILYAKHTTGNVSMLSHLTEFTITLKVYLQTLTVSGEHDIIGSGDYSNGFRLTVCGDQIRLYYGGGNFYKSVLSSTADWYRITVVGDTSSNYIALYFNKATDTTPTKIFENTTKSVVLATAYTLTIGAQSNAGAAVAQTWYNSGSDFTKSLKIADVKIYSYTTVLSQITQLLKGEAMKSNISPVSSIVRVTSSITYKQGDNVYEYDIPTSTTVTREDGKERSADIVWTWGNEQGTGFILRGIVIGKGVNDGKGVKTNIAFSGESKLRLNDIFCDNMVLQRGKKVEIYGVTAPYASTCVVFGDQKKYSNADKNGNFSMYLDAMSATATGKQLIVCADGYNKYINNVIVGEVVFASGQSNMAYPLFEFTYAESIIRNNPSHADYPKYTSSTYKTVMSQLNAFSNYSKLRFYTQKYNPDSSGYNSRIITNQWVCPTSSSDTNLTKVSYTSICYAINLYNELNVPVGIAMAAVGGTRLHEWLNPTDANAIYPGWTNSLRYTNMYLTMGRITCSHMIWYQGESDCDSTTHVTRYNEGFRRYVAQMRSFLKDENLAIITYQLVQYGTNNIWLNFRELQQKLANELDGVYLVGGIDTGDHDNIHPTDKMVLNDRAVGIAMKYVYGASTASGAYGEAPQVISAIRTVGTDTVTLTLKDATSLSLGSGTKLPFLVSDDKTNYSNVSSYSFSGNKIILHTTKKYISYLQSTYFDFNSAFIYNEKQNVLGPFQNIEIKYESFNVTFKNADGSNKEVKSIEYNTNVTMPSYTPQSGKVFIGWLDGDGNLYDINDSVKVLKAMTLTAKELAFSSVSGARIRLANTLSDSGLRFELKFNTAEFNAVSSFVKYGGLILPTDTVGGKEINLNNFVAGSTILKIQADKSKSQQSGSDTYYHVAISNLKTGNYNRAFSVRGYIEITYSSGHTGYVYTGYNATDNSRSVRTIASTFKATTYYDNLYVYQKEIIDAYAG